MRRISVVPHQKEWIDHFKKEQKKLQHLFGATALGIHHIGSTAIPTIHAKPIIDILVEVTNIHEVDSFNTELMSQGYEVLGENGIKGRRFFTRGGDERTHHVHIFETGNEEISRHLAFRDYLLAHPEEAQLYSELKQRLSEEYTYDPEGYTNGKGRFIREIDRKAKEEFQ